MKKSLQRRGVPAIVRLLLAVIFLVGVSIFCTWFILWRQQMADTTKTWEFINENPRIFWYSSLLIFLMVAAVSAAVWGVFLGSGICFGIFSVITYIHMQKFQFRAAPLLPEDFAMADQAGGLINFVDIWGIVRLVVGVIFIIVGAIFLEYSARRIFGRKNIKQLPWWERFSMIPRVSLTLVALVGFILAADPIVRRNEETAFGIPWLGVEFEAWNQTSNYEWNGFVIGFLYNLGRASVDEPKDYNEERIAEIAKHYQAKKEEDDANREDLDKVVDNLIIILDETFYDPELLDKYYPHTGGDPLPNLREIFKKYPSGYMYSPEYGGGTANVEFEVMTGLSNYWANTTPYVEIVPKLTGLTSAVSIAKDAGFKATAIHASNGSMYKRNLVYPKLGYDVFYDSSTMKHTDRENGISWYISDEAVYKEILDVLKEDDDKKMIGVATMQNHTPYITAWYEDIQFWVSSEKYRDDLLYNIQSLHNSDKYLGEFLAELDKLEEKTAVLWFGDHAAALLDDYILSDDKSERDLAHLTPFFIYTNFDTEGLFTEEEVKKMNAETGFTLPTKGVDLPITSPNCLSNELYDILGIKKPSLYYLVSEVCAETPILTRAYYESGIAGEVSEALKDYELVNYDILNGKYYWPEK